MATINVKNNRNETLAGDITFNGEVIINGDFSPVAIESSLPTLDAEHSALIAIGDGNGGILGYVKVFPLDA